MHKGSPEINTDGRKFWASLWLFSLVQQRRRRGMCTVATCLRNRAMQPAARLVNTTIRQQPALTHGPQTLLHISSGQFRGNDDNVMSPNHHHHHHLLQLWLCFGTARSSWLATRLLALVAPYCSLHEMHMKFLELTLHWRACTGFVQLQRTRTHVSFILFHFNWPP